MTKEKKNRHPGQVLLEDFLKPRNISQIELSNHLNWTYARLNEIINGRRGLTADSALTLAQAFNTEAEFWMDIQRDWELWHAKKDHIKVRPIQLNKK